MRYNSVMAKNNKQTVEVDGRQYDADTVSEAMLAAILGRAPVAVMKDMDLIDGILDRLRWAHGAVSPISTHRDDADEDVTNAASAAALQLEQAREMFRALTDRWEGSGLPAG